MQEALLFDAVRVPSKGQASDRDYYDLPPGAAVLLQNFEDRDGPLKARNGCAKVGSSPAANPHANAGCVAYKILTVAGTDYHISAWWNTGSGVIRFYSYNSVSGAFTAIDSTSGASQYGNTSASSDALTYRIEMVVLRDPRAGKEYIVITAGQYWRVYDPVGSTFAKHRAVSLPSGGHYGSKPTFPSYLTVANSGYTTYTNSGANWTGADSGASTVDNEVQLDRNTTAATDPTVKIEFTTGTLDASNSPQIVFGLRYWAQGQVDKIKWEISEDDATYYALYDPTSTTLAYGIEEVAVDGGNDRKMVAFSCEHIPSASRNAIKYIKLTYVGSAPSAAERLYIFLICASGEAPGERYHELSLVNSATRGESEKIEVQSVQPELIRNLGGPTLGQLRIPWSRRLRYNYSLSYVNPDSTDLGRGVDTLFVYANDPNDPDGRYRYCKQATIATWNSGSGQWEASSTAAPYVYAVTDDVRTNERVQQAYSPSRSQLGLPDYPTCAIVANKRLIVGTRSTDAAAPALAAYGKLWVSDAGNPFRFRAVANVNDNASGFCDEMQGDFPLALASTASRIPGVSYVYVFGYHNTYLRSGLLTAEIAKVTWVANIGALNYRSVVELNGVIYVRDRERRIYRVTGLQVQDISTKLVGDVFRSFNQSNTRVIESFAVDNTIRFFLGSSLYAGKTVCMIFDHLTNRWRKHVYAFEVDYVAVLDGTIYAACTDGYVRQLDKSGAADDDGTALSQRVQYILAQPLAMALNSIGVITNATQNATLTAIVTYEGDTQLSTGVLTWPATTGTWDIWEAPFATVVAEGNGRHEGHVALIDLQFALAAGKAVRAIGVEYTDSVNSPRALDA